MRGPMRGGLPLNATITSRRDLHDGLAILEITLSGWELPPFEAGQFIDIALQVRSTVHQSFVANSAQYAPNELIRRSYSIASSPDRRDRLELLLNLVPRGEFTPTLWRLGEGDRLHVDPRVRGRFTLRAVEDETQPPHVVMIATGTGLAPYMSMIRYAESHGVPWKSATLLHSVREVQDLAYRDELEELADLNELKLQYIPTVTRAGEGVWPGSSDRVQNLLDRERYAFLTNGGRIDPGDTHIYLCGHPDMIRELTDRFEDLGFSRNTANQPGNLHYESYW